MKPLVVVTDFVGEPLDIERAVLGSEAEVVAAGALTEGDLAGKVEEAEALLVYHFISVTDATLARLKQCKLIVRCGAGTDNVDGKAAAKRGIPLANVPDYGTEDVADTAIGLMLSLTRGTHRLNMQGRPLDSQWHYKTAAPLRRLRGRVFGVVGLGRIGTAAALRAKAFGMDVVFYDPYVRDGFDKALGLRRAWSLEELLKQSHVVSLHCPLTDETRRIVRAETLAMMPKDSYLVNTARGDVVDTKALADALNDGRLAGAGIDVLPQEPPSPDDALVKAWRDPNHPAHERLILTPHAAFYTEEGLDDMRRKGCENVLRVLRGDAPRNVVNL